MDFRSSTKKIAAGIAAGIVLIFIPLAAPVFAYENLAHPSSILKCQTSCHKAENIAKARQEKMSKAECRDCHAGTLAITAKSPFLPVEKLRRISSEGTSALHRSLLKSSLQVAVNSKKNPAKKAAAKSKKPSHPTDIPGMAYIPAGEFIMGSNERWDDEAPEYIAATDAFYLDLYEITNEDYKKFVAATGHEAPYHWPEGAIPQGKEKHPVVYVSWFDARDYCEWNGKRLPTEEEWEKASRGENGLIYPWGDEWTLDKSNNPYKHSTGTEPVGSYPDGRSPYGLYDMSGNVWEWVDSYYLPHPGNTVMRAEYGKDKRVLKGGSWFDCLSYGCGLSAPTFNRSFFTPEVRNNSFGFRCAKSP